MSDLVDAAVASAFLDANGNLGPVPDCPGAPRQKFHFEEVCETRPVRLGLGHEERRSIYERLKHSGQGASLVPNQRTVTCPVEVQSLENSLSVKGMDTTWIVENTGSNSVVVAWVVDGIEWSPFHPDVKAVDDPEARIPPGDWLNVPTFDSFVYHAREVEADGTVGQVVLQHRVGLIPIGKPDNLHCDLSKPDVEPVDPDTADRVEEFARTPTRRATCNIIDIGFRNEAGCPLHLYWAGGNDDTPDSGFNCGEKFKMHLGTKPATQDFMHDWESTTKFEGTFIGHTFVARLASDPSVVVDHHTIQTTKIVDCPNLKQKVSTGSQQEAEAIVAADGVIHQVDNAEDQIDMQLGREAVMGTMAQGGAVSS